MRIAPFSIRRVIGSLVLGIGLFTSTFKAAAEIVISEFMASNSRTLADEDNAYPDWIELQNNGADAINLDRWTLAGSPQTPPGKRWTFPSTNLPAGGFLVVFASGKDRRQPGAPLHTGFQLNRAGDSIILRDPQGALADGAFVHPFPPQASDVSYGRGRESVDIPLITAHALGQFVVPDSGRWDDDWTSPLFLPAGWSQGAGSWGYDNRASGSLPPLSGLRQDVRKTLFGKSATAYLRIPFQVQDPATFDSLTLTVSYPDGFAAFLNGIEAVSDNRPPVLAWNSAASEARDWLADGLPRRFELSGDVLSALRVGTNWLAVQGLAIAPTNVAFILDATLTGARAASSANNLRYFTVPTPGKPNGLGTRQLGPIFSDPSPPPADPSPDQSIAVSTRVSPSFNPVTRVELRYRVMFGAEVSLPMLDDGKRQDGRARDGVYGAIIPARVASPGEMIRWYCVAEDAAGNTSRWPAFEDPKRSPAYWGTMARTNDSSTLPGFHWFVDEQNAKTASTLIGARCAVYSQGELYDNVEVRIRGQLSLYWGKQSYKFDFNPGRLFQYDPASPRVEEVNLNSTWSDKSYSRTVLAWESYRDGGTPYCRSFPMRVCQNGRFFSVAVFVEQPDERWLTRNGLDPSGSLFKMNSAMDSVSGVQKKIPRDGDLAELEALIQSISTANPNRV
ncbi:MAG: lamin tail domain-containing protein, partial [Verrucomicrobia bacterium]|nr:lamin tail domain-containing protein [Verrucomicrobiota bacterium]